MCIRDRHNTGDCDISPGLTQQWFIRKLAELELILQDRPVESRVTPKANTTLHRNLDATVDDLVLYAASYRIFKREGIKHVRQIIDIGNDLLKVKGIGIRQYMQIAEEVHSLTGILIPLSFPLNYSPSFKIK